MSQTTQSEAVHLPLPEPWPTPHPDCGVCQALAGQREQARASGDYSKVTDLIVEIRAHRDPHVRRRR